MVRGDGRMAFGDDVVHAIHQSARLLLHVLPHCGVGTDLTRDDERDAGRIREQSEVARVLRIGSPSLGHTRERLIPFVGVRVTLDREPDVHEGAVVSRW